MNSYVENDYASNSSFSKINVQEYSIFRTSKMLQLLKIKNVYTGISMALQGEEEEDAALNDILQNE